MNLGQAVAVTLYELARDSKPMHFCRMRIASHDAELERLTGVLLESLEISGYATPATLSPRPKRKLDGWCAV